MGPDSAVGMPTVSVAALAADPSVAKGTDSVAGKVAGKAADKATGCGTNSATCTTNGCGWTST